MNKPIIRERLLLNTEYLHSLNLIAKGFNTVNVKLYGDTVIIGEVQVDLKQIANIDYLLSVGQDSNKMEHTRTTDSDEVGVYYRKDEEFLIGKYGKLHLDILTMLQLKHHSRANKPIKENPTQIFSEITYDIFEKYTGIDRHVRMSNDNLFHESFAKIGKRYFKAERHAYLVLGQVPILQGTPKDLTTEQVQTIIDHKCFYRIGEKEHFFYNSDLYRVELLNSFIKLPSEYIFSFYKSIK